MPHIYSIIGSRSSLTNYNLLISDERRTNTQFSNRHHELQSLVVDNVVKYPKKFYLIFDRTASTEC